MYIYLTLTFSPPLACPGFFHRHTYTRKHMCNAQNTRASARARARAHTHTHTHTARESDQ